MFISYNKKNIDREIDRIVFKTDKEIEDIKDDLKKIVKTNYIPD